MTFVIVAILLIAVAVGLVYFMGKKQKQQQPQPPASPQKPQSPAPPQPFDSAQGKPPQNPVS